MKSTSSQKTWKAIEKKLENAHGIIGKKKKLLERLRKAEEEKATVPEKIYSKVRSEYTKELDEIQEKIGPLEEEIIQTREEISAEIKELDTIVNAANEGITEAKFRHLVGEYDDATLAQKCDPLKKNISENLERKKELMEAFEKLDRLFDAFRGTEDRNTSDSRTKKGKASESTSVSDDNDSSSPGPCDSSKQFEDPHKWLDECNAEEDDLAGEDRPQKDWDNADPLANLADPTFDDSCESSSEKRAKEQRGLHEEDLNKSAPILIINKGPRSKKKIPVLPITMTIGREHDNNIEIKDGEVSRYHARIVHKNGEYVLETLESSTGTWVNGEKISKTVLKDSDIIKIGRTEMSFTWK